MLTSGHCSVGVWTRPRTDVTRDYHEAPPGGQHGIFRHNLHILVQCLGRGRNFKDCRWMGFVGPGILRGLVVGREDSSPGICAMNVTGSGQIPCIGFVISYLISCTLKQSRKVI